MSKPEFYNYSVNYIVKLRLKALVEKPSVKDKRKDTFLWLEDSLGINDDT